MLLSDRMRAVAGLVSPCNSIADIGCDHGYVSMELIRSRTCKHVIAMDINSGPLERAERNICDYGMQDYIETRISDGAGALKAGETEGMICAGMGGKLIVSILSKSINIVNEMKQLVLQPQSEIDEVRRYLRDGGFWIEKEDMVFEDGKYYPMMRALPAAFGKQERQMAGYLEKKRKRDRSFVGEVQMGMLPPDISETSKDEAARLTRVQDTYGPYLLEKSHPVLKQYLLNQKDSFENIRSNLQNQSRITARQQQRIAELDETLGDIVFCLYYFF